jgi:hypothetical protein
VVVLPREECRVPRVDALVPGHGPSVLCSAMQTECDSLSFAGRWLPAYLEYTSMYGAPAP